jgi:hypothetical protein
MLSRIFYLKLPPYTLAGFDLTTHNSAGGDDTTRPRRHSNFWQLNIGDFIKPNFVIYIWIYIETIAKCFAKTSSLELKNNVDVSLAFMYLRRLNFSPKIWYDEKITTGPRQLYNS